MNVPAKYRHESGRLLVADLNCDPRTTDESKASYYCTNDRICIEYLPLGSVEDKPTEFNHQGLK